MRVLLLQMNMEQPNAEDSTIVKQLKRGVYVDGKLSNTQEMHTPLAF